MKKYNVINTELFDDYDLNILKSSGLIDKQYQLRFLQGKSSSSLASNIKK